MWYSTLSTSWTSTPQLIPSDVLRRCYIFNSWLWRFCTRYMAISAVYGDHDMCCFDRPTYPGKEIDVEIIDVE